MVKAISPTKIRKAASPYASRRSAADCV